MELTVRPVAGGDAGEGVAVLAAETMTALGLTDGDPVLLRGADGAEAGASARTGTLDGADGETVRIDRSLRRTLDRDVGEAVTVEPVEATVADCVTVALGTVDPEAIASLGFREQLVDRVVTAGQRVTVTPNTGSASGGGTHTADSHHRILVTVLETVPTGPVVVGETSRLRFDHEALDGDPALHDFPGQHSQPTYADIGGLDAELERIRETVELPLRNPDLFSRLGVDPPNGVLLYGPPGTGKTLVARAMAAETDINFETVSGPTIASKHPDEAESRLRDVFADAHGADPSIVFVDELDAIAADAEDRRSRTGRIGAQLLSLIDELDTQDRVVVVATTNRVDAVDPALRRPGRLDREIQIGVPDRDGREEILRIHTRDMPLADDVDIERYAEKTHGFVGADLANVARESALRTLRRVRTEWNVEGSLPPEALESLRVTGADCDAALTSIEPSALREVFVEVPDVTWDDIGGLPDATQRLQETVQWPLRYPDAFERLRLNPAKGVLLYGPPGTGKTLLAKAVANEADSNFISIKGPELLDKYVGESEQGVREVFATARENAPTVVFFDEIDALAAERGGTAGGAGAGERVVSQLLTELDGLEELEDVVVIATTNRPELLDDALMRPGRFDRHVHVGAPDEAGRRDIFEIHTADRPLADDVDLDALASRTAGYVGADIEAVCREAATAAVRSYVASGDDVRAIRLTGAHFETGLDAVSPSGTVADEETAHFETHDEDRTDGA
jgi:transitional endoplasmic reticulum ATPase